MKICLVIPTRGLIFARTVRSAILNPELPHDSEVVLVQDLPIPDAHNECIAHALDTDCTHIWFVEDDMEVPPTALTWMKKLAEDGNRYVAVDYDVRPNVSSISWDMGKPLFTGFGCTMFDRTLFEKEFKEPWLTDEYWVSIEQQNPFKYHIVQRDTSKDTYGKYDVYFGVQCREKGIAITVVDGVKCNHLRLKTYERKETNHGLYDIYQI
jgi:hypothetical protein